ncbi:MAG: metallophosphoesterase family protein [Planctomycetota bacterium]
MPETFAIISDIHSNLEALTAVFKRIDELGVREVVCLGDIVGYGSEPEACIDLVRERCSLVLRGNHDDAIFNEATDFNPIARSVIEWTRRTLEPGFFRSAAKKERWVFLKGLVPRHVRGDILFVHGSPRDPIREYVMRTDVLLAPGKLKELFTRFDRVCFLGHTHQPGIFLPGGVHLSPSQVSNRFVIGTEKAMINVGSVGQPRDGDNRACFVVINISSAGEIEVRFERVPYEFRNTMRKILANPAIHDMCATRLEIGR